MQNIPFALLSVLSWQQITNNNTTNIALCSVLWWKHKISLHLFPFMITPNIALFPVFYADQPFQKIPRRFFLYKARRFFLYCPNIHLVLYSVIVFAELRSEHFVWCFRKHSRWWWNTCYRAGAVFPGGVGAGKTAPIPSNSISPTSSGCNHTQTPSMHDLFHC